MIKFTLYKSAQAIRTIHAEDLQAALGQCPEMNNPTVFVHEYGAHQWAVVFADDYDADQSVGGNIPYELIAE
jgi:hypothetical protein